MKIIGHRGAAGLSPENTLPSFQRALELGVDGVELDVHALHGRLLVIHDDTLERTTNATGPLTDHSLVALRGFDAGNGAPIPFLEEVLQIAARALVNVELKGAGTAAPVAKCLQKFPGAKVLVSSFKHHELMDFRHEDSHTPVAPLFSKPDAAMFDLTDTLRATSVNVSRRIIDEDLIDNAHARGLKVWVYTVNSAREMTKLEALGVDAVFTDFPDRVPPAIRAHD